jgi:hypothetical protein
MIGLLLLALLSPAAAKDCGVLPKGENPSPAELDAEIARASAEHGVPTEIIKGVAWQESSCQQWRRDGSFVVNKTDCGFGLMQLTGATAEQFDVDRLKRDWRYNLDCGVRVLRQKWARAERKKLVPSDPAARRVLENWYYAVAFYWGGRSEEYLRKIFRHVEQRPGTLQALLRRPVEITIASEVIPGFSFGDAFQALPDNRLVDASGKTHRARTTLGTIGDAETLAALDGWLARGRKAAERGKTRTAVKYLARVLEVGLDTDHGAQAEQLLTPFLAEGEAALAQAEELHAAGQTRKASSLLKKLARDFKGHPLASRAEELREALKK